MSRTPVEHDAVNESFASLLGRLADRSKLRDEESAMPADFASRAASSISAALRSSDYGDSYSTRRVKRALAPVSELKANRAASLSDGAALSYEQALRLHSRRAAVADADFDPQDLTVANKAIPPDNHDLSEREHRSQSKSAVANTPFGRPATAAQSRQATELKSTDRQKVTPADRPRRLKSDGRNSFVGKKSRSKSRPANVSESIKRVSVPLTESSAAKSKAQSQPTSVPGPQSEGAAKKRKTPTPSSEVRGKAQRQLARVSRGMQLESPAQLSQLTYPLDQLNHLLNHQLEQRSATVSVRLNDAEFTRLRSRAAESGMSVSAYMRSCVLEAEHLRAQVKQALSEMRSAQLESQTVAIAALSAPAQNGAEGGGTWAKLLSRSFGFLLSHWVPFRRNA
jgi:hypothetical protein